MGDPITANKTAVSRVGVSDIWHAADHRVCLFDSDRLDAHHFRRPLWNAPLEAVEASWATAADE